MASIVKRTRKDGSTSYHVKYRPGDGRERWEHVPGPKKEARARVREIESELHKSDGRWIPPAAVNFGDYAERWLEE